MSDRKEEANLMTDSLNEVRDIARNSQYSSGKGSNSASRDSSFLLNQQQLEGENSQSGFRMVSNSTLPNSDPEVFLSSKLDDVLDQNKFPENFKHALKNSSTATGDSYSEQHLTLESNSIADYASYQPEAKTEKPVPASSTTKVSAIISALDPKKSRASSEFPRVQETVYQPYAHETSQPIPTRIPPEISPPVELISMKNSPEMSLGFTYDDVSGHSASSDVKPARKIPNYMAATLSAKAKVRSHGIPKLSPEAQQKKRNPLLSSYAKPPPFHETLRTSLSHASMSAGISENSKREWQS